MAAANANVQVKQVNEVAMDGVVKEQVFMEKITSKAWESKWGFMKDFDKLCLEAAANLGISEEEYRRMARKKKDPKQHATCELERKCKSSDPVPVTSSGYVGWRGKDRECSLELCGPLYISPRHTIDPPWEVKQRVTQIILG